tara:strand:- start:972 stop:2630 length:1659 start_codon:yes stop_codon:yes gene_type:complete
MSGCALKPVKDMSVDGFAMNLDNIRISMVCPPATCHSPGLKALAEQFNKQDSIDQINEFVHWLFTTISNKNPTSRHSTAFSDDVTEGMNDLIAYGHRKCDHPNDPEPHKYDGNFPWIHHGCFYLGIACALVATLSFLQVFILCKFHGDETILDEQVLANNPDDAPEVAGLDDRRVSVARPYDFEEKNIPALGFHRVTQAWARISVPFILAASYLLFLSAITGIGEKIIMFFKFAEYEGQVNLTRPVTLTGSLYNMWNAHVYVLFIMVVFAGCIWPFAKILLLVVLWYIPPHYIKSHRRGKILEVVDFLGKLAYGDMFVIVNNMSTFSLFLQNPETWPGSNLLPTHFLTLGMVVIPKSAFYFFILAAFLSQFSPTYILHLHRRAVAVDRLPTDKRSAAVATCKLTPEETQTPAKALSKHSFAISSRHRDVTAPGEVVERERTPAELRTSYLQVTRLGRFIGGLAILIPFVCLACVVRFKIMQFTILGVGGRLAGNQHIRSMSLWDFATGVVPTHYPANFGTQNKYDKRLKIRSYCQKFWCFVFCFVQCIFSIF